MGACGAAVLRANGTSRRIVAHEERMARGHAEALMPMVAEVMVEAGADFAELDLIAATLGPGSFTGVRIAIAAARGIALATGAKLWGTDSLTVMARAALVSGAIVSDGKPFAVAVDARGSTLYFGLYDGAGRKIQGPLLLDADEAAALLPGNLAVAVGSGAANLAAAALRHQRELDAKLPDLQPSAAVLAELALEVGETLPTLRPLYLRPPDAKPQGTALMISGAQFSPIAIRLAGPGDAEIMAAIHAACFARDWDAAAIAPFLGAPGCLSLLAATAEGEPAQGLLIARVAGDEAELLTLGVLPACRRLGLARVLLGAAKIALRGAGAKQLFLEMEEANAPARGLYQSLGAVVVGRRPRYYEHGSDAAIVSLAL
jgi:tRNA threonylcarbamoyl adenosine modification protein YeaZ